MVHVENTWRCAVLREPEPGLWGILPDVALKKEAVIAEVGRAAKAAGHLPIFLHDLDHLTHGCKRAGERTDHLDTLQESAGGETFCTEIPIQHIPHWSTKESSSLLSGVQSVNRGTSKGTLSMFCKWGLTW